MIHIERTKKIIAAMPEVAQPMMRRMMSEIEDLRAAEPQAALDRIDQLLKTTPERRYDRLDELIETEAMYKDLCR